MPTFALSGSAQEIVPQNLLRVSFIIQNQDTLIFMYIKRERGATVSATDHDLRVGPGETVALNALIDGAAQVQDRYTIIPASGTPRVSWFETENFKR